MTIDADTHHPDKWGPGLHLAGKRLNVKAVRRAADPGKVLPVCLSHNLRTGNEGHRHRSRIDLARTGSNEVLRGPACPLVAAELVQTTLDELGIVPARRDAIMGVELVFQPPDGHDTPAFWSECLRWADGRYQHVVSAVVHRDQKRPHLHVIALAVAGGKLAGNDLTAGARRFPIQRVEFLAHVFAALGMRPNRRADPVERLALTTGKGAKTHAAAARRDAKLNREAGADWKRSDVCIGVDVHRGSPVEGVTSGPTPMHRPLILRSASPSEAIPENGPQTPVFEATTAAPLTPCPKPFRAGKTTRRSAPKTADNWRHRQPPAVLTPTLPGWC